MLTYSLEASTSADDTASRPPLQYLSPSGALTMLSLGLLVFEDGGGEGEVRLVGYF